MLKVWLLIWVIPGHVNGGYSVMETHMSDTECKTRLVELIDEKRGQGACFETTGAILSEGLKK